MDFLTFKSFISIKALITFYYIGAIILPFALWFFITWIIRKYRLFSIASENIKKIFWKSLTKNQRIKIASLFIIIFLFMELFWRMLFEFLIAYIQIRDVLMKACI
jgi:hypothetical protein